MLISDIYRKHPKTIRPDATLEEALQSLIENKINALLVVDGRDHLVGILTLPDIATATIPRQFRRNIAMAAAMYRPGFFTQMCGDIKDDHVSEHMHTNFISVTLDDNIMAVTADFLMNDLYIVPVVEDGKLVGVVTRSEIKHALLTGMKQAEAANHDRRS